MAHMAGLNSHTGLALLLGAIVFALGTLAYIVFADAEEVSAVQPTDPSPEQSVKAD